MSLEENIRKLLETKNGAGLNLSGADLISADLSGADLSGAILEGANLTGAKLKGANLISADLISAKLFLADLKGADLSGANLSGADLEGAILSGANLKGADLSETNLMQSVLENAVLLGADLIGANLELAVLKGANLSGANLENFLFIETNLIDADLTGANLSGAELNEVKLIGANLSGANLERALLEYSHLSGANLEGANLRGAKLLEVNLEGADLSGAILKNTSFTDTDVSGADFTNAIEITEQELRDAGALNVDNALNIPQTSIVYSESEEPPEFEYTIEPDTMIIPPRTEEYFEEPREDQFISYFTLTGKLKSIKNKVLINLNEEVESYDPIEMETINVTIKDYIKKDKDNIVIAYENREGKNEYFFTKHSTIATTYLDLSDIEKEEERKEIIEEAEYRDFYRKENLVFPCKKADNTALMPREENVIKYAYFDLAKLGFINAPQKYCDMQKYDINRNNQLFAVVPLVDASGEQANYPSFVGLEVHNNPTANLVSALHCQGGQENKVCRLIVGTPTCGDAKSIVKGPSEGGRKKKTFKKGGKKKKSLTNGGKKKKTIKKTRKGKNNIKS